MATAACSSVSALTASEHGEPGLKSCVFCSAKQPEDGRFLHCLHVSCARCLKEHLTPGGCVECEACSIETKPGFPSVPISKQLVSSRFGTSEPSEEFPCGEHDIPVCDFCETNAAKAATHECEDCDGAFLCWTHAQDHSKKRVFRTHSVTELNATSSGNSDTGRKQVQYSCPLHGKHEVTDFCRTCQVVACEQCLLRGHRQHDVVSLSETAAEQRVVLGNELPANDGHTAWQTAHTSSEIPLSKLTTMKSALEEEVTHSNNEATAASKVITEAFSGVRSLLDQREAELLILVDAVRWKQQRAAENQLHRLDIIEQKNTTAVEIGKFLTSEESVGCDAEVMLLAPLVLSKMKSFKSDIDLEQRTPSTSGNIHARAECKDLQRLDQWIEDMVSVSSGPGIDLQRCRVEFPSPLEVGQECTAHLHLVQRSSSSEAVVADSEESLKVLEVSVTTPSSDPGSRSSPVAELSAGTTPGTVRFRLRLTRPGRHVLHVRSGSLARDFEFSVMYKLAFDKQRCSHNITVSDSGLAVHFSGTRNGFNNVLGTEPYTSGTHRWSVQVLGEDLGSGNMAIGVTTAADGDCLTQCLSDTGYWWWSHSLMDGIAEVTRDQRSAANCTKWQDGDVLDFTLDCDARTLELHNRRVNESKTMHNLSSDGKPLFMFVCLYARDRLVSLIGTTRNTPE
eukprot:scpid54847/ scgid8263/ E3 ubiquitin-protein ligase TRIM33; Ectodermin homolog; RET-fused gene 7 protein; Transcription intermediary factor 1-gamma; Tripartite motif-containing protein 33